MRDRVRFTAAIVALMLIGSASAPAAAAAAPVPGEHILVSDVLNQLRVEAPSPATFDRTLFREERDLDGDGCITTQEVLVEESDVPPTMVDGCAVASGQWQSYYDNIVHTDPAAVELNHLVAMKEAWLSGAWSWTAAQREAFANDVGDPRTLTMLTVATSAAKADKDPAAWLPPSPFPSARCTYVSEWVAVKWRWNLAVDHAEKAAIQKVLAGCVQETLVAPPLPADRPGIPPADTRYYIAKYDGTIWAVTATSVRALTFAQWQAAGAPKPLPAPTEYVKYAWSPTISAVTMFGTDKSRWVWKHVSAAEWKRAGNPKPRTAGWIEGSTYYQWADYRQIFVQDVGGKKHALTAAEWAASGYQPFEKRPNQAFVKLSWHPSIAFLVDYASGIGSPIDGARWTAEGNPTPVVRTRLPNDVVWQTYGSGTIYYSGPTVTKALTPAEWRAMGSPRPEVRGAPAAPPRPARDMDCGDYRSQAAAQADFNRYFPWYGDVFRLDSDNDGIACESHFR